MTDRQAALDAAYKTADSLGLEITDLKTDGTWQRVPVVGKKKNNRSGAYCLSEYNLKSGRVAIVGSMTNHVSGEEIRLTLDDQIEATPEEIAEAKKQAVVIAKKNREEKIKLQAEVAKKATDLFGNLPDNGKSKYLDQKKVKAWGIRFTRGSICVPAINAKGKIQTLQFINPEGDKKFLSGGAKRGHFHLIKKMPDDSRAHSILGFAEGYATAATLHEQLGHEMAITFDAGNILPVAQALRKIWPDRPFVFFADHDIHKGYEQAFIKLSQLTGAVEKQIDLLAEIRPDVQVELVADDDPRLKDKNKHPNRGVVEAIMAAAAVDGVVVVPQFSDQEAIA